MHQHLAHAAHARARTPPVLLRWNRLRQRDDLPPGHLERERHEAGGQAAALGRNRGNQRRNTSSNSLLRTFVRVCTSKCAPFSVHCICCFFTNRRLTTRLIVDSTYAV